jgi:hypothetical protein
MNEVESLSSVKSVYLLVGWLVVGTTTTATAINKYTHNSSFFFFFFIHRRFHIEGYLKNRALFSRSLRVGMAGTPFFSFLSSKNLLIISYNNKKKYVYIII